MSISFELNGEGVAVEADPDMPLLWVIREKLGLTGTKFGCGIAACGACTMHVDGVATRTCVLPRCTCMRQCKACMRDVPTARKQTPSRLLTATRPVAM